MEGIGLTFVGKLVNGSLSRERLIPLARLSSQEMHSSKKL
jgi:hypothetical protein